MANKDERGVSGLLSVFLRLSCGMTQQEFGQAARIDQSEISRFELGARDSSEELFRRMAATAGVAWSSVVHLRRVYEVILGKPAQAASASGKGTTKLETAILEAALLAMSPYLIERGVAREAGPTPERAILEAKEVWAALEPLAMEERRWLLGFSRRAACSWALAKEICEASVLAAANSAEEAMALAKLAVELAERIPDDERWRARVLGFCWAHVANALRVATDFAGADAVFSRASKLWQAGAAAGPALLEWLPGWRLLDLEASLRREQRRFPEALERLDQALAASGGNPVANARVFLKKEHVFEQMRDLPRALAALDEAAPWVELAGDPQMHVILRFKRANHLCHLGRFPEAAEQLPELRRLAAARGQKLHQIRIAWLTAKIAGGQGRTNEARAGLEQVLAAFTEQELAYEAALAGLDLAELRLSSGHTAEVRELAAGMAWIFNAKGIAREALVALKLFAEAARQERATVELTRRVAEEIERAGRGARASLRTHP